MPTALCKYPDLQTIWILTQFWILLNCCWWWDVSAWQKVWVYRFSSLVPIQLMSGHLFSTPNLSPWNFYHDLKCSFCKAVRFALLASLSYICLLYSSILCWIYPPTSGVWQHCRSRVWEQNCCCFNFNLPGRASNACSRQLQGTIGAQDGSLFPSIILRILMFISFPFLSPQRPKVSNGCSAD